MLLNGRIQGHSLVADMTHSVRPNQRRAGSTFGLRRSAAEMSATTVLLVAGSLPGSMTLWYVERRAAP